MRTPTILIILVSLFFNLSFSQSVHWEIELGSNIFDHEITAENLIVVHGESNGDKVVNSERIYPDVSAIDNITGEIAWEIKSPFAMMAMYYRNNPRVEVEKLGHKNYIRFGHLLIVDPKDGTILFNPASKGISAVQYSKVFPVGILATGLIHGERKQFFIPFSTFEIAWEKEDELDTNTNKKDSSLYQMMSSNPNFRDSFPAKDEGNPYKGYYINGAYIVQHFSEFISYDLLTGNENWRFRTKKFISKFTYSTENETDKTILYCSTFKGASSGKNILYAIDLQTGNLLWEKEILNSIADLVPVENLGGVLINPTRSLKKGYVQIFSPAGEKLVNDTSLRRFGNGIEFVFNSSKGIVIVADSGVKSTNGIFPSRKGRMFTTKSLALINIVDLTTKQYVFEKNIKTGDRVNYLETLDAGLMVVENNQAYVIDYKTGKEINDPILAKDHVLFLDNNKGAYYLTAAASDKLYKLDKATGLTTELFNIRKANVFLKFVHEIIESEDAIILSGTNLNEDLSFIKLNVNGELIYDKNISSNSILDSWHLPIIGNKIYKITDHIKRNSNALSVINLDTGEVTNTMSYDIATDKGWKNNVGHFSVDETKEIIYHFPMAELATPFDKKAKAFNARGVITAKRF